MKAALLCLLLFTRIAAAEDIPTIPLHVVVISDHPEVTAVLTAEAAQWLAESLTQEFHTGDGRALARFKVVAFTAASDVASLNPAYLKISSSSEFSALRNDILGSAVFRRDALNIFVYYNPSKSSRSQGGFKIQGKKISGRYQKDYRAWVLFEWKALRRKDARLLLHETGHAFGLPHVKPIPETENSPDRNIMTGSEDSPQALPDGEKGYYFTPSQAEIVSKNAAVMSETFNAPRRAHR